MKLFEFLVDDGLRMGFLRPDRNYGLIARQVDGVWEKLIISGGVVLASEARSIREVRVFIPHLMDSPPWRDEK